MEEICQKTFNMRKTCEQGGGEKCAKPLNEGQKNLDGGKIFLKTPKEG